MKLQPLKSFRAMLVHGWLILSLLAVSSQAQALDRTNFENTMKDTKVSVNIRQGTLLDLFADIEAQTSFVFVYPQEVKDLNVKVNVVAQKKNLESVLQEVLSARGLVFNQVSSNIIINRSIVLETETVPAKAAPFNISGFITDQETKTPLPGVNILIVGTSFGTMTGADGKFTLTIPEGSTTIRISSIGYQPQDAQVRQEQDYYEFILVSQSSPLDEVIVVGYGVSKLRDVTGNVSSVPKDRLELVPNLNLSQAIQGVIPGVSVNQDQAGAASSESIVIRGRNSILASNGPLIVVDGVPYNGQLRDININDVSAIEILKDASAAAIYGSRGANGVILVTTKAGKTGAPKVTLESRYATQQYIRIPDFMNGSDFLDFKNLREPGNVTATEQQNYDAGNYTDWKELALQNGSSLQNNLSVQGGTDKVKYYLGGNALNVKGLSITDLYKRITGRINLDIAVTDWLKVGTRSQYSTENQDGSSLNYGDVFVMNPLVNAYDGDGNLLLYPWPEFTDIVNPLEPKNYKNQDRSYQIITNNYLDVSVPFVPGLSYKFNTGITNRFSDASTYRGRDTRAGQQAGGSADIQKGKMSTVVLENILSYTKSWASHQLSATALYSYQKDQLENSNLHAEGFPNDIQSFYGASQAKLIVPEFQFSQSVILSQMLRVNYGYKEKYLLTLTGRRDGFSGFGDNSKWGFFPSAAAAWNISNEEFYPWKDLVDYLKLRVSFGQNGNQAVGPFQSIARYTEQNYVSGGSSIAGFIPSTLGDPTLGWETSQTLDIGIDFGIIGNRVLGNIDAYQTNTSDLLLNRTISPVHGISSITQNIGETRNIGIETGLTTQNLVGDFKWSTTANASYVKNQIVSLGLVKDGSELDDVANALFINQPITSNFDFKYDGVWQTSEKDEAAKYGSLPGYVKLEDTTEDGVLKADDRKIIGQRDPKFFWGLTNTFSYKNFSLNIFVHGVHGVTKMNELLQDRSSSSGVRRNVVSKNWWTPDNPTNDFYANNLLADRMSGFIANIYQNAGFVRVKDVTLSYTVPAVALEKTIFSSIKLYVNARNLFTFTKWQQSDPELNFGRGAIPLQREFVFGVVLSN